MKSFSKALAGALLACCAFSGCYGPLVEVPSGHVGRIKTSSGFQEEIKHTSLFRLPWNWTGFNPTKLVLAQTSDNPVHEPLTVFMPDDKLNLTFELTGTFSVSSDKEHVNSIYARLVPENTNNSYVQRISFKKVYDTYGAPEIKTVGREVITRHKIEYVLNNLHSVSEEIQKAVNERLVGTPLTIMYCGLGPVQPPDIILNAQANAKKREIDIGKAQAQKLIDLTKAETDYQVGLVEQEIELIEAETQVLADVVLSDAVSKAYIAQRALRVLKNFASNPNTTFVLSTRVFEEPASLLGHSIQTSQQLNQNEEARRLRLEKALKLIAEGKVDAKERAEREAEEAKKSTAAHAGGFTNPDNSATTGQKP